MADRENKTVKTPLGKELVLKTYLTARERRELRNLYFSKSKINVSADGKNEMQMTDNSVLQEYEDTIIKLAVVSYDGSGENILDRLLDEKGEEMDFVMAQANGIDVVPKAEK